ncbi:MAG: M28 family peptidase [Nitrolancea sp.]
MPLDDVLREVSADNAWESILHITGDIPSRLAGSENARRMAEFAHQKLRDAGVDAELDQFMGLVSFPEPATITVLSPESFVIDGFTLAQSASTDGLEGELIYIGAGAESDYEGRDMRGKIGLTAFPYAPARHEKALIAWKHGSAGQIMMNFGDEQCDAYAFGSVKSAWGNPTPEALEHESPDLPCVSISRVDGLRLQALCERGPVRVRIQCKTANGWHELTMTSGEFGADPGHEFLLLGGHMDSWFGPQATDNASGDACILELARVFKQHEGELRRGLVTALWMGHETGTMISSTRFADVNWDRLRRSCVAYLQVDQPAIAGSGLWHTASTEDIQSYSMRIARETIGNMPVRWGRQRKNGDSSFFGVGLAALAGEMMMSEEVTQRTALANLGWFHHSAHNTLDRVDRSLLAPHLEVYTRWMWGLLTAPILPHEYEPLGRAFVDRLTELNTYDVPGIDMSGALDVARDFHRLATELDHQSDVWSDRIAAGTSNEDSVADRINQTKLRVSRVLVPIASTVVGAYGQDRYGHAWQSQMIPSLMPYPQLASYARDSEEFQTWWVSMIRARNRTVDALSLASETMRDALADLG